MDTFSVKDQCIAITGASSGFGHHFAGVLAARGAKVALGARRTEKVQARVDEITAAGGTAVGLALDVNDAASIDAFLDQTAETFGRIDVVINNAGIEPGAKTFLTTEEDDWDAVIDTNLKAPWAMSKAYTRRVIDRDWGGGNIVNVASITAYRTIKGQFAYAVSKGAMVRATEVMALEAARYKVRVNALAPGYILTDVSRVLLESERSQAFMKGIPMRRYGEFEDLDGPLLLLASDASRWMTGSVIVVDGGHICGEM